MIATFKKNSTKIAGTERAVAAAFERAKTSGRSLRRELEEAGLTWEQATRRITGGK